MAEDNVIDSINQINTEAVPQALAAAGQFEESLADISNKMQSFQRNADTKLDGYQRDLNEQLTSAEMQLEDTERRLQVLMDRLSGNVSEKATDVEDSTAKRQELMEDFSAESENIDSEIDSFDGALSTFQSEAEGLSSEVADGVSNYQETTNNLHEELGSAFENFRDVHAIAAKEIAGTLEEGTDAIIEKMSSLKDNIETQLEEYEGLYGEVIDVLTEQTGSEAEGFTEAMEFAQNTAENLNDVFGGSIGDVSDKLEEIAGLIETIKPILDFIEDLT